MIRTGRTQVAALFAIFLGTACLLFFNPPFIVQIIFVLVCFSWAAWYFMEIFRGPDEVESASVRYALAFASGLGAPLSITFVMVMSAVPAIQDAITFMASSAENNLSPAAAGFGLGVAFAVFALCTSLCVGSTIWWASKR
ncbi:hypothetical protein [uncultured Litoreibacter sp.]|uniref:hypothetical protein n=1 Tax=uncultured Litoreibacter sp. TaxID=1392394 RepID=UPI00263A33E6|nr:hypothetical protein [uncultured Litoreibacter sp.]